MSIPIRLGKRPARQDERTLRLARYLPVKLPKPPASRDWTNGILSWGMMLNDQLGDCTIAGAAHAIQVWTANLGQMHTESDATVLEYYKKWAGYDPKHPSTDIGAVELDILNKWRKQGMAGHQLIAYADPDPGNIEHVKQAICLFGGLYIGLNLPVSAQSQKVWDVVPRDGGLWGGHCVYIGGYDEKTLTSITWGGVQKMTWAFWKRYCDESHALLSQDWLPHYGNTLKISALENDLLAIQN